MPTDQDTKVKLLDAKIAVIFDLLRVHTYEEALCILENVKIKLEASEDLPLECAEVAKKDATLEAGADVTVPA